MHVVEEVCHHDGYGVALLSVEVLMPFQDVENLKGDMAEEHDDLAGCNLVPQHMGSL